MGIFFFNFIMSFSFFIAFFSAIAIVVSIFVVAMDNVKWWIGILLAFAISVSLHQASSKTLKTIIPKNLEKSIGHE